MAKYLSDRQLVVLTCITVVFGYVACVKVTVIRKNQDILTYPMDNSSCKSISNVLQKRNATCTDCTARNGVCCCKCGPNHSTFLQGVLGCVSNRKMRGQMNGNYRWIYLLSGSNDPSNPVKVLPLNANKDKIKLKINGNVRQGSMIKKCQSHLIETTNSSGEWTSIKKEMYKITIDEPQPKDKDYHVPLNLTLNWKNVSPSSYFGGKIMRIRIQCNTTGANLTLNGFIVFKVSGTRQVEIPKDSAKSDSSRFSVSRSTVVRHSESSKISHTTSEVTASFHQSQRLSVEASPTLVHKSSNFHVTSSVIQSSTNVLSQSPPIPLTLTATENKLPFHLVSSTIISLYPSTMPSSMAEKQSDDFPVAGVVTGAVIGVFVALALAFFLIYILWKRRLKHSGKQDPGGRGNSVEKTSRNVPLPTLSNPVFQEGAYENPEDVHKDKKHHSGIKSIQSALYDNCLVVENPSAREGIASVYDNIPGQKNENTYQDLDPAKRVPSNKYQSLLKPCNESTTITDQFTFLVYHHN